MKEKELEILKELEEEYEYLNIFLEGQFIPNNVIIQRVENEITGEVEFLPTINFNQIFKLQLEEFDLDYVLMFIKSKNIKITGINCDLNYELNNSRYKQIFESKKLPKKVSWQQQLEWFIEYKNTNDLEIKKKIVLANMRAVRFLAYPLAHAFKVDINELSSYGYEELIKLIDTFDITKGLKFTTYAVPSIRGVLFSQVPQLLGFRKLEIYNEYVAARKKIADLKEEFSMLEIIEIIQNEYAYSNRKIKNVYGEISLSDAFLENVDDYSENIDYVDNTSLDKEILNKLAKKIIEDLLVKLSPKQRNVIIDRYGLKDGNPKTLKEIGEKRNVSDEAIRLCEMYALKNLREIINSEDLEVLLNEYDNLNFESPYFKKY